jgi:hypothetical protein
VGVQFRAFWRGVWSRVGVGSVLPEDVNNNEPWRSRYCSIRDEPEGGWYDQVEGGSNEWRWRWSSSSSSGSVVVVVFSGRW